MSKTILIVEDDNNIADLLRIYLEKEGYHAAIAPDGGAGVELYRKLHPDLVLLDLMLPVMDGYGVLRAIRADSNTPVIMLTAKGETMDKVSGLKLGADDYITKPFEMKEVLARVGRGDGRRAEIAPADVRQARHRSGRLRAHRRRKKGRRAAEGNGAFISPRLNAEPRLHAQPAARRGLGL